MVDENQGGHSAILLKDGKVLISGGVLYPSGVGHAAPSLYDPATGMFTPDGDLYGTRYSSTATLLDDGRALLVGGWRDGDVSAYDPVSRNWMFLAYLPIWGHTSTRLSNGTVLIIGGLFFTGSDFYNDYGEESLNTAQIYDPHDLLLRATGSLLQARGGHTATLLSSGLVLVAGGDWNYIHTLASAELYDPVTGGFADGGGMTVGRSGHTATLLRDGRVLLAGGDNLGTAELYIPPASALWQQATIAMQTAAGNNSQNFWQWAWYWQYLSAFQGAPSGFGVVGSISPALMEQIITAGGGDGSQLISAEQWVLYFRQVIPQ